MQTFTDEQVTEAIEKVVRGKRDYVYDSGRKREAGCFYSTESGEPSCIVGHVIHTLNPGAFEKVAAKEAKLGQSWDVTGAVWAADGGLNISTEAEFALQEAQNAQDGGYTWGVAVSAYRESLGVEA